LTFSPFRFQPVSIFDIRLSPDFFIVDFRDFRLLRQPVIFIADYAITLRRQPPLFRYEEEPLAAKG